MNIWNVSHFYIPSFVVSVCLYLFIFFVKRLKIQLEIQNTISAFAFFLFNFCFLNVFIDFLELSRWLRYSIKNLQC